MARCVLEDIDDAFAARPAFLRPVDRSRRLILPLVVFFVGGPGAGFNAFQYNVPSGRAGPPGGPLWPVEVGPRAWVFGATLVAAVALPIGLVTLLVEGITVQLVVPATVSVLHTVSAGLGLLLVALSTRGPDRNRTE